MWMIFRISSVISFSSFSDQIVGNPISEIHPKDMNLKDNNIHLFISIGFYIIEIIVLHNFL